jgi:hypothetical protein
MSSAEKSDKVSYSFCGLFRFLFETDFVGGYQKVKVSFPRNGANIEYNVGKTLGRFAYDDLLLNREKF